MIKKFHKYSLIVINRLSHVAHIISAIGIFPNLLFMEMLKLLF